MNTKPAVLENFVFDWALYFHLCEVCRFQNLVALESPIKHTLNNIFIKYTRDVIEYKFANKEQPVV